MLLLQTLNRLRPIFVHILFFPIIATIPCANCLSILVSFEWFDYRIVLKIPLRPMALSAACCMLAMCMASCHHHSELFTNVVRNLRAVKLQLFTHCNCCHTDGQFAQIIKYRRGFAGLCCANNKQYDEKYLEMDLA